MMNDSPNTEGTVMSEFETVLRRRVDSVYQELAEARRDGQDYLVDLHRARLEELFDLAARNEVNARSWVDLDVEIPRQGRS